MGVIIILNLCTIMLSAPPRFLRGGYGIAFVTLIMVMNYKFMTITHSLRNEWERKNSKSCPKTAKTP